MNYKKLFLLCPLIISFLSCHQQNSAGISQMTQTPTAIPTPTPVPLPTSTPAPTPVPQGPAFKLIQSNREMMSPDQIMKYGKNMKGKKVAGWIGYVFKVIEVNPDVSRLVIDMNPNRGTLPDVILENVPSSITKQLQERDKINFSGTIQGYVNIPESKYTLSLEDVTIYGFDK